MEARFEPQFKFEFKTHFFEIVAEGFTNCYLFQRNKFKKRNNYVKRNIYSECLKSEQKPVRISARSDFGHLGLLGHTQNVWISACSDFRQCLKSECLNVYHWLLNGLQQAFLFWFDTPTFSLTE